MCKSENIVFKISLSKIMTALGFALAALFLIQANAKTIAVTYNEEGINVPSIIQCNKAITRCMGASEDTVWAAKNEGSGFKAVLMDSAGGIPASVRLDNGTVDFINNNGLTELSMILEGSTEGTIEGGVFCSTDVQGKVSYLIDNIIYRQDDSQNWLRSTAGNVSSRDNGETMVINGTDKMASFTENCPINVMVNQIASYTLPQGVVNVSFVQDGGAVWGSGAVDFDTAGDELVYSVSNDYKEGVNMLLEDENGNTKTIPIYLRHPQSTQSKTTEEETPVEVTPEPWTPPPGAI